MARGRPQPQHGVPGLARFFAANASSDRFRAGFGATLALLISPPWSAAPCPRQESRGGLRLRGSDDSVESDPQRPPVQGENAIDVHAARAARERGAASPMIENVERVVRRPEERPRQAPTISE